MLNEEKINSNYVLWQTKLKDNDCYSEQLMEIYGDDIRTASYGMEENSGSAYDGALINCVLYKICRYAVTINNMLPEAIKVNQKSLLKVCLLQHISKSIMYVKETDPYWVKKGKRYTYSSFGTSLKSGERSVLMCIQNGIQLTDEEYEAMRIIDKDTNDKTNYHSSMLATIVKCSNELANSILKNEYKIKTQNTTNNNNE